MINNEHFLYTIIFCLNKISFFAISVSLIERVIVKIDREGLKKDIDFISTLKRFYNSFHIQTIWCETCIVCLIYLVTFSLGVS